MKILLSALLWSLSAAALSVHAQDIDAQSLYADYCSVCHGDRGDGQSHAQQGLVPPPRDFTSPESAVELIRPRIIAAIRDGVPGTAMSGWKSRLDDAQIAALADLIRSRFMQPGASAGAAEGNRVYAEYCSVCHGDDGRGAMWATSGLSPRPANFTDPAFQAEMSREHMIQTVRYGRAETAMTGWETRLSDAQIGAVVDYVIAAFMPGIGDTAKASQTTEHLHADGHRHQHSHADTDDQLARYLNEQLPDGLRGNADRGETLYRENCTACHGENGDGRGPRAYFINPKPRNFLHAASRASLNRPTLQEAIGKGRLRTEMPAWEKVLDAQQIADVGEYVFVTFIQP